MADTPKQPDLETLKRTVATLKRIDSSPHDNEISSDEMATHLVNKYKAEHGGSDKGLRTSLTAIATYDKLSEQWKQQGVNGKVTPTMMGKASEARDAAIQELNSLLQEQERVVGSVATTIADARAYAAQAEREVQAQALAARQADARAAERARNGAVAVPPGIAAAAQAQGTDLAANMAAILRGETPSDPRMAEKLAEQRAKINGRIGEVVDKSLAGAASSTPTAISKLDEGIQRQADYLRSIGQGAVADKMLQAYNAPPNENPKQPNAAAYKAGLPQEVARLAQEEGDKMKAQLRNNAAGQYERNTPQAAPVFTPEMRDAVQGLLKEAVGYEGHVNRAGLSDLKKVLGMPETGVAAPAAGAKR